MNFLLLIAGVLDPKWPAEPATGRLPQRSPDRLVMSPFDEAALETALAVRDFMPRTMIRAIVIGGREAEKIARAVAAFNVPVATLEIADWWDQMCVADALAGACGNSDLVLLGREFGDCDDGAVPALLAARLGRPSSLAPRRFATGASCANPAIRRMADASQCRVVVSVTNDRRNRLRKPLMKNVMMARRAGIETLPPFERKSLAQLSAVRSLAGSRRAVECELVEGSPDQQAARLAQMLA